MCIIINSVCTPKVVPLTPQLGSHVEWKRGLEMKEEHRFSPVCFCQDQQLPSDPEWRSLETIQRMLKRRSELQKSTAGTEQTWPRLHVDNGSFSVQLPG